ncbi:hypothetical protein PybrP1_001626 [[Pythium] brassicae (nom. inval.)]|nr:hypothetical protein PybrP1_001626 [[Pythium] brassicae (nom. inval.)]
MYSEKLGLLPCRVDGDVISA